MWWRNNGKPSDPFRDVDAVMFQMTDTFPIFKCVPAGSSGFQRARTNPHVSSHCSVYIKSASVLFISFLFLTCGSSRIFFKRSTVLAALFITDRRTAFKSFIEAQGLPLSARRDPGFPMWKPWKLKFGKGLWRLLELYVAVWNHAEVLSGSFGFVSGWKFYFSCGDVFRGLGLDLLATVAAENFSCNVVDVTG